MAGYEIGLWSLGLLFLLLSLRMPIGLALLFVSLGGVYLLRGSFTALHLLKIGPFDFLSHWGLSAIPMFLLMGAIASKCGISDRLFIAANLWLGRLPGGLAVATNWASAVFAAASGSSMATAAAMGRVAIPEMLKQGYQPAFAAGVVASAGTLGALIPPSILLLLYGVFAEQSITLLLIAGVIPGILTAFIYMALIMIRAKFDPKIAPPTNYTAPMAEKVASLSGVWPVTLVIAGIILGLYLGVVTATEAGAFGAAMTAIVAFFNRGLTWKTLKESVTETATTTVNIFFVAMAASIFASFLALSGFTVWASEIIFSNDMSNFSIIMMVVLIYLFLGMFLDPLGILLLTLPILIPILEKSGMNMIWFGVIVVKLIEIGCLTPPVGLNVFVVKSVVGDRISLGQLFKGVSWFLIAEIVIMALLISFPALSTWLPSTMQ